MTGLGILFGDHVHSFVYELLVVDAADVLEAAADPHVDFVAGAVAAAERRLHQYQVAAGLTQKAVMQEVRHETRKSPLEGTRYKSSETIS